MACTAKRSILAVLLPLAFCNTSAQAAATGPSTPHAMQCWTDDRGQRACGDQVAPSEARRQRELINQRGVVKQVIPAQKTAEQAAADAKARDDQKLQHDYDRYLLQSYQSLAEIQAVQNERLVALDGRMALAQKALGDNTRVLEDLHQREKAVPAEGETLDPALKRQVREFTVALEGNRSAIARIIQERQALNEQFSRDMQRYQVLRESVRTPDSR